MAIGIATYLTRRPDEFSGQAKGGDPAFVIRRFGYRLDSVKTWQPVNWAEFQLEAEQLGGVEKLSGDIINFLRAISGKKTPQFATETLGRPATAWRQKMNTLHLSEADRLSSTQGFLGTLRVMSHSDIAALEPRLRNDYFQKQLGEARLLRDKLYESFDKESRELAMPSTRGR